MLSARSPYSPRVGSVGAWDGVLVEGGVCCPLDRLVPCVVWPSKLRVCTTTHCIRTGSHEQSEATIDPKGMYPLLFSRRVLVRITAVFLRVITAMQNQSSATGVALVFYVPGMAIE